MTTKTPLYGLARRLWTVAAAFVTLSLTSCGGSEAPLQASLIPQPVSATTSGQGVFKLESGMAVTAADPSLDAAASYLIQALDKDASLKLTAGESGVITLSTGLDNENPEAYELRIDKKGITIQGASAQGVVHGIATLRQLASQNPAEIPYAKISDQPRFEYRGMHLDVSRHFSTDQEVKDLIDLMARYKFNKFHWHLTDDQGWRIEIRQYPELTAQGGWRSFDGNDRQCMRLAVQEDNPDMLIPREQLRIENGDTLYGGFYTQDQIRDVVAYAAERGIDVIPELDMPGHMMAAERGYPWLACFGEAAWGKDFSAPICPGKDEVMEFVKNVYREVFELFPYEYVHLGADEVEKINWEVCPHCQARIKAEGLKDEKELQAWFVLEMEKFFRENGKRMIGWDEIVEGGGLAPEATIMWWRDWAPKAVSEAASKGNKIIVTPDFLLYFDFIEMKPDVQRIYETEPTAYDRRWDLSEEQKQYIWGMQANTWRERIPSTARTQYQMLPRMFALSEIVWVQPEAKNWESFEKRMVDQIAYLDRQGINYRIPDFTGFNDINVFVDTAMVTVNTILPNVEIRYTTDGSFPNKNSTLYTGAFPITESTDYIFRGFRPDGSMGMMQKAEFRKESYIPGAEVSPATEGIRAVQHEFRGRRCERIKEGKVAGEYVLNDVSIPEQAGGWLGMIYEGYLEFPEDGIYTFSLTSDDGSMMYIDDQMLIDNDGPHGPTEKVAQRAIGKGWHKIRVEYFDGNNGGVLTFRMAAPGQTDLTEVTGFKH